MTIPATLAPRAELPEAIFTDFSSLNALKQGSENATDDSQLREAASQFSAIFLHMALKSMREASFGGGILDSQQSEFYRDMFDQQIALDLSSNEGFGLSRIIVDQLSPPKTPQARNAADTYSQIQESAELAEKEITGQTRGDVNKTLPGVRSDVNSTSRVDKP